MKAFADKVSKTLPPVNSSIKKLIKLHFIELKKMTSAEIKGRSNSRERGKAVPG